jgi:hypothetical protein
MGNSVGSFFPSGSMVEGESYARWFCQKSFQDMDFLVIVGELHSNDELVPVVGAPGFVRVKWNEENLFDFFHENIESIQFIRAFVSFSSGGGEEIQGESLLKPKRNGRVQFFKKSKYSSQFELS